MNSCFVIQPFDDGRFDKRFDDTFAPAIIAAGMEPYRVDRDPASVVPIEDVEVGIRRSDACFAEITTDNPNVWFELGFAIAARKPVVIACAEDRERFPFDVQHRSIIRYKTDSASDFSELGDKITQRLKAAVERHARFETVESISPTVPTAGLTQHELVALIAIAAASMDGDPLTAYGLRQEMSQAGYTDVAAALAIRALERKEFVERAEGYDGANQYWGFIASPSGLDWLDSNQKRIKLKHDPEPPSSDNELPF